MKIILILPLLIASSLLSNELSWVDEQVNAIKPNRNGTSNKKISKLKNPFIYLKKNLSKEKQDMYNKIAEEKAKLAKDKMIEDAAKAKNGSKVLYDSKKGAVTFANDNAKTPSVIFNLNAIINSSALINGDWYKLGDKIHKYKITNITKTTVTLVKNKRTTIISTKSNANKLKFK